MYPKFLYQRHFQKSTLMYLHPRKSWLIKHRSNELSSARSKFLPALYDPDAVFVGIRKLCTNVVKENEPLSASFEGQARIEADGTETTEEPRKSSFRDYSAVAGEAAALYGVGAYEKLQQVDSHVYQAMSKLAGRNIDSLTDLHSSLGTYSHDFLGELTDGALNKWKGHLAESIAADHFQAAGHTIEWPETSNQEGWDFMLDGHEANVKLVADASNLHEHFAKFNDIAAVVPDDTTLGGLAEHAYHIDPTQGLDANLGVFLDASDGHAAIVDHALSAAAVKDQAMGAADLAVGGPSAADAHFPWITLATSGWREAKLLNDGKTDLKSATVNLTTDVVGRGGGAALGAKAGAAVGTMIYPGLGTAIGAVAGGIFGALAGGSAGNKVKRRDLDSSLRALESGKQDLRMLQVKLERISKEQFESAKSQLQCELDEHRKAAKESIESKADQLSRWVDSTRSLDSDEAREWIETAARNLIQVCTSIDVQLKAQGFWCRWIWPSVQSLALEQASIESQARQRLLEAYYEQIGQTERVELSELASSLSKTGLARERFEERLRRTETERLEREQDLRARISEAYEALALRRQEAFHKLSTTAQTIAEGVRQRLRPALSNLETLVGNVKRERGKLGLT